MKIQRITFCAVFVAATMAAIAAAENQATSADKARQAISVLQSSAPAAEKAMACKDLAVYGKADAVPALSPLLASEDLNSWARIALEAIPHRAADDALREALGKVQGWLLVGVINSIGVRGGDVRAVKPLGAKLQDADPLVASSAAVALGHIGGDQAASALTKALGNSLGEVRSAVAQGCILCAEKELAAGRASKAVRLYDTLREADLPQQRRLEATRGAILARQAKGLPLLLETLRSTDKAIFDMGLHTARELPGQEVTEALVEELAKNPPDRQGPLLLAIADRDDAAVLPAILNAIKTGAKDLRLVAIEILLRQGNIAGVPVLLDSVADSDAEVAQAAKSALVGLFGDAVDRQLCVRLVQATGRTRRALAEIAGLRRTAAAVPELVKTANDADPAVRAAGVKALGETVVAASLDTLTGLLAKANSEDDRSMIQDALESACTRLPDKAACAGRVLASLEGSATPVRCALLRVLVAVGTPNALAAVHSALSSPDAAVRDTAVRVLADWPEPAALPALTEIHQSTQDATHRFLALRGCVRLVGLSEQPAADKLKTLRDLLGRTERSDDRKVILSGLANVHDAAALRLAESFLDDAQVQAEAEMAVISIAEGIRESAPGEARAAATRLQAESKNQVTRDRAAKLLRGAGKRR